MSGTPAKRLPQETWLEIRQKWELGSTFAQLAQEYDLSVSSIHERKTREGWQRDTTRLIERVVSDKLIGVDPSLEPNTVEQMRLQLAELEADKVVQVILRHRDEWRELDPMIQTAIDLQDKKLAFLAKTLAETIAIKQEGERKAWGLDKMQTQPAPPTLIQNNLNIDLGNFSEAELVTIRTAADRIAGSRPEPSPRSD